MRRGYLMTGSSGVAAGLAQYNQVDLQTFREAQATGDHQLQGHSLRCS
jgi:hypothetical protein